MPNNRILILEPCYHGQYRKIVDTMTLFLPNNSYTRITMATLRWEWPERATSCVQYLARQIPYAHDYKSMLCSSVLPLADLIELRPDLMPLNKVVYFHENKFEMERKNGQITNFQHGYTDMKTSMAADYLLFNSKYNLESFLSAVENYLMISPSFRLKNLPAEIKAKSTVVHFPLDLDLMDRCLDNIERQPCEVLHIIWPHQWHLDMDPGALYRVLVKLEERGCDFRLSILGEIFEPDQKPAFNQLFQRFEREKLLHFGHVGNAEEYFTILRNADVVLSTAAQEFFGSAVLEAVYCGCVPVVPNRLSYKELFGGKVNEMYDTESELLQILIRLCEEKAEGNLERSYKALAEPYHAGHWYLNLLRVAHCSPFNVAG